MTDRKRLSLKYFFEGLSIIFFASHVKQINGKQWRHKLKLLKNIFHATKLYFECINYSSKERYTCTRGYIISYNLLTEIILS